MEKKFVDRSLVHKVYSMLKWLEISEDKIRSVLSLQSILTKSEIVNNTIGDSFLDDNVVIELLIDFFSEEGFRFLRETISTKKTLSDYYCGICSKNYDEDWIECDSCLIWFHQTCILNTNALSESFLESDWFCNICK